MNPSEQDSVDLADLVSRLWRDGQRTAARPSTAQAASQETPYPLATDFQQHGQKQTAQHRRPHVGSILDRPRNPRMIAESTICDTLQRKSPDPCSSGDDSLRTIALRLLQSSGYSALRGLRCEVTDSVVIVQGVVSSYFLKQMAQTVLRQLDGVENVRNLVEVRQCDHLQSVDEPDDGGKL
jgi:hypothetical protein